MTKMNPALDASARLSIGVTVEILEDPRTSCVDCRGLQDVRVRTCGSTIITCRGSAPALLRHVAQMVAEAIEIETRCALTLN
jgi:hypothetical protein